jgi:lipoprotein-releasing system permease protein
VLQFPLQLAFAHLRRRKTQNLLSMLGVAVGVMVLTTALSLTNGFVSALIETTTKALPHVNVISWDSGRGGVKPNAKLEDFFRTSKEVEGWSPYALTKGLVTRRATDGRGGNKDFAQIIGVDPKLEVGALNLDVVTNNLLETLPADGMLLGDALASSINALPGDTIWVLSPQGLDTSNLNRKAFRLMGTFRTGNYLIDAASGFVALPALQALLETPNRIDGYHVKLADPERAPDFGFKLPKEARFQAQPWQAINGQLLEQMALQKLVIYIVLSLMVIVAILGMVNVLVLSVLEKTPEIAILRAMGASSRSISLVFLLEGLFLGVAGLILGNILGLALSYYFKLRPLEIPGGLYFITALPTRIRASDFLSVSAVSLVATLLAALLPARRAASIEPAKIIR